jgi:hypothetical protein
VFDLANQMCKRGLSWRTWSNWKRLPRWDAPDATSLVRPHATKLSIGQAIVLLAIAYTRIDPETLEPLSPRKPLPSDDELWWIINHQLIPNKPLLVGDFLEGAIGSKEMKPGVGRFWVRTKELPALLEKRGYVGVGLRSLYKKIPDLISHRQKHFPLHIEQYCRALDALSQRKAG